MINEILVAQIATIGAFLGCIAFSALYMLWYPWWRSETGVHLFSFVAVLGIMDGLFAVSTLWPQQLWLGHALIVAFTPEPFLIWWRVSLLVRVRRAEGRTRSAVRAGERDGAGEVVAEGDTA